MSVKLLAEHHLEFLSLKEGCKGSSEPTLVKMPHCWKTYVVAHTIAIEGEIRCSRGRLSPPKKRETRTCPWVPFSAKFRPLWRLFRHSHPLAYSMIVS